MKATVDDTIPEDTRTAPLRVGVLEAARLIGVSRARLYEHIKDGSIKSVKDGARTLFTMGELRAFVARSDVSEDQISGIESSDNRAAPLTK